MSRAKAIPKIGFVSPGCPKALSDSERILSRLRAEGYGVSSSYDGADLVVVNTCGFVTDAVEESLCAIGEALNENGKVIVTGCLGARAEIVKAAHPNVLAITGPNAPAELFSAIHEHLPQPHDPFSSLVPPQGIRLTPYSPITGETTRSSIRGFRYSQIAASRTFHSAAITAKRSRLSTCPCISCVTPSTTS